jgi:hypothetical protein
MSNKIHSNQLLYPLSGSFSGSLEGTSSYATTASYVQNAVSASYVLQAVSSSFASTASYVQTAQTASYVLQAVSASFASTVPSTGIVGDIIRIATGSVTASVTPTGFTVVSGSMTEFSVTGTGVTIGSAVTDIHQVTGSLNITGSLNVTGSATFNTVASGASSIGVSMTPTNTTTANSQIHYGLKVAQTLTNAGNYTNQSRALDVSIGTANLIFGDFNSPNAYSNTNNEPSLFINRTLSSGWSNLYFSNTFQTAFLAGLRFNPSGELRLGTFLSGGYTTIMNNTTEVARFTGGNLLLQNGGTFTDNGYRLQITSGISGSLWASGSVVITGSLTTNGNTTLTSTQNITSTPILTISGSVSASAALARSVNISPTLIASASNDILVGLDINSTVNIGSFTGTQNIAARFQTGSLVVGASSYTLMSYSAVPQLYVGGNTFLNGTTQLVGNLRINLNGTDLNFGQQSAIATNSLLWYGSNSTGVYFGNYQTNPVDILVGGNTTGNIKLRVFNSGNVTIGSTTDNGYRLQVTSGISGSLSLTGSVSASGALARSVLITPTLIASASNDVLVAQDINPTFSISASLTPVSTVALRLQSGSLVMGTTGNVVNGQATSKPSILINSTQGIHVTNNLAFNPPSFYNGNTCGYSVSSGAGSYANGVAVAIAGNNSNDIVNGTGFGVAVYSGNSSFCSITAPATGKTLYNYASVQVYNGGTHSSLQYGFFSRPFFGTGYTTTVTSLVDFSTDPAVFQGTATASIANRYGLYLNHDNTNVTSSWGVYQTNGNVKNYFNGNTIIGGTAIDNGYKLQIALGTSGSLSVSGSVLISGSLLMPSGSNTRVGTATLVAGNTSVANTTVTANSLIYLTTQTVGGTPGALYVGTKSAGVSFAVSSSLATDTSTFAYFIIN